MSVLLFALAVIGVLLVVVVVHESGHFIFGKLSGIKVEEFAVGFGPKLWSRHAGETLYSLRAIPAGGFVRMAGMLGLVGETDAGERNFYRATIPKRAMTIAAGITFNAILAGLCFTLVNMVATSPWSVPKHGPATTAGLRPGDVVLSLNGTPIRNTYDDVTRDLHAATVASQGRPITVTYRAASRAVHTSVIRPELVVDNGVQSGELPPGEYVVSAIDGAPVGSGDPSALITRAGVRVDVYTRTGDGSAGRAYTGVVFPSNPGVVDGYPDSSFAAVMASWRVGIAAGYDGEALPAALVNGFARIPSFISQTADGIYTLVTVPALGGLTGRAGLSGPVGIATQTVSAAQDGFFSQSGYVHWIGLISLNLAIVNVLPIPFLDGGKLFFLGLEAIRRKRLEPRHEAIASAIGLALVLVLVVYVTIGDVSRLAGGQ